MGINSGFSKASLGVKIDFLEALAKLLVAPMQL
jgi:hypothetical protein